MSVGKSKKYMQQGMMYQKKGNFSAAFKCYEKAVAADKRNIDASIILGNIYFQRKMLNEAENYFSNVISINPGHVDALNKLGIIYFYTRQHEKAIDSYNKILKLQPNNAGAHYNIAISLIECGYRKESVNHLNKAIELTPENIDAHILLASALTTLGDFEGAKESYENARKIDVENMDAIGGEAFSRIKLGDKEGAYDLIRKYINTDCSNPSIALATAMTSSVHNDLSGAVEFLERALKKATFNNKQKAQLYFEAGNLLDKSNKYDLAFEYYKKGNDLIQAKYDAVQEEKYIDNIINVFSKSMLDRNINGVENQPTPVFIVGMPRSGTSLVEQILSSHSEVYGAGEISDIQEEVSAWGRRLEDGMSYPDIVNNISESDIQAAAEKYIEKYTKNNPNISVITNKLPHNFMYLGLISMIFPNALIIHCTRNALDTCISNYFQLFSGPLDYSYNLENIAHHYIGYQKLMDHWNSVLSLPIFEVRYEELINNQEDVTRQLLEFCGLGWDAECMEFHKSIRVTRTASNDQVRQPMHNKSINRWKNYEKYLDVLAPLEERTAKYC